MFLLFILFPQNPGDFASQLHELKRLRKGHETNLSLVEEVASTLLSNNDLLDAERGKVCYEVAHIYAQTGHQDPDRLAYFVKRSLEFNENLEDRLRLHMYQGDSFSADSRKEFSKARLLAAGSYRLIPHGTWRVRGRFLSEKSREPRLSV